MICLVFMKTFLRLNRVSIVGGNHTKYFYSQNTNYVNCCQLALQSEACMANMRQQGAAQTKVLARSD